MRALGRLGGSSGSCGGGGTGVLGSREIAGDLVLANFEDDKFVGRHARSAAHVELDGLAGGFVFLFDGAVVDENRDGIFGLFLVGLVERDLHGADFLRGLALGDLEFVVVAIAAALQLFEVVAIVRD